MNLFLPLKQLQPCSPVAQPISKKPRPSFDKTTAEHSDSAYEEALRTTAAGYSLWDGYLPGSPSISAVIAALPEQKGMRDELVYPLEYTHRIEEADVWIAKTEAMVEIISARKIAAPRGKANRLVPLLTSAAPSAEAVSRIVEIEIDREDLRHLSREVSILDPTFDERQSRGGKITKSRYAKTPYSKPKSPSSKTMSTMKKVIAVVSFKEDDGAAPVVASDPSIEELFPELFSLPSQNDVFQSQEALDPAKLSALTALQQEELDFEALLAEFGQ